MKTITQFWTITAWKSETTQSGRKLFRVSATGPNQGESILFEADDDWRVNVPAQVRVTVELIEEWLADGVRQCDEAGVPVFVKQDSAMKPGQQGRISDELWRRKEWPGGGR